MKRNNETAAYTYIENVSASTTNKWVYIEKTITAPADVTSMNFRLDNNGNGVVWFDDIRLHPADAEMTSFTYEPLVGVSSTTDNKNQISKYEYDRLGRLHMVRDKDNNVLKVICYNYAGQPENCTAGFQNDLKSKTFTVNNCQPGAVGSSVTYSVPAGTYTSLISKEDANKKALDEIALIGQQHTNNTGTCLFYNKEKKQSFTRDNCGSGTNPSAVEYTVPANTYNSPVSQVAADQLALNDIITNGQNYANTTGTCGFTNDRKSQVFTRTTCTANYKPGTYEYVVPEGKYYSAISKQDANQQALDEIATNGQTTANSNASCTMVYLWLAHEQSNYYEDDYSVIEDWNYWIEFYANANKTQQLYVPFAFNINYNLQIYTGGGGGSYNNSYSVPANSNTYWIGETRVYQSTPEWYESTTIKLLAGSFYTLLQTF